MVLIWILSRSQSDISYYWLFFSIDSLEIVQPDSIEMLKKTDCILLWDMCFAKGNKEESEHIF